MDNLHHQHKHSDSHQVRAKYQLLTPFYQKMILISAISQFATVPILQKMYTAD